MTYILSIFLILFNIIQKKLKFPVIMLLIFMWILAGFNYFNADRNNYLRIYNYVAHDITQLRHEQGFLLLNRVSQLLGLSFDSFLKIYFMICLLLIFRLISKYSPHPGFVLSLFFVFTFIIDVTQIRNFMMMAIIINAVPLLATPNKKNIILYILLCVMASTVHSSAIFYLVFIIIPFASKEKLLKVMLFVVPFLTVFSNYLLLIISRIFPFLEDTLGAYTGYNVSILTGTLLLIYIISGGGIIYFFWKKIGDLSGKYKISPNLAEVILKINILIIMMYPLFLYGFTFLRIHRNIFVLNYILVSNVLFIRRNKFISDIVLNVIFVMYVILSCWYFIYLDFSHSVFIPLFENNRIFE